MSDWADELFGFMCEHTGESQALWCMWESLSGWRDLQLWCVQKDRLRFWEDVVFRNVYGSLYRCDTLWCVWKRMW